jgi:TRAP-type uncharacterized transport system substrate-binding protein
MPSQSPASAPIAPARPRLRDALVSAGLPTVALLALLLLALLAAAWRVLQPTPERRLVIATGPEQSAYAEFAKRYEAPLRAQGVELTLRASSGAAENLALLRDPRSGVQAAFVQGGVETAAQTDAATAAVAAAESAAASAASGAASTPVASAAPAVAIVSLGSVAVEPLWLFYRSPQRPPGRGAAPPALDQLAQLRSWRIHTGPAGGGSGPLFAQLAAAHGLPAGKLVSGGDAAVSGVVDLLQGKVDALALVSAADAPLLQYLLVTPGVELFHFAQAQALARRFPFLHPLVLPRGVVDLAADLPPRDLQLIGTTATLAARADLHPALMQLLLQAARSAHAGAGWFNRRGEFPNATTDTLPLAPEAERFHRSGPPWLQRYLPFWAASFLDRMWIVLLPLLAALLPLSRVVPPLVTLRLRSRVYRWYANLRAVEQALEKPGADLARLRQELEHIDAQTEHIGLPLSFTGELYDLRAHIQLVRKRLLARAAGAPGDTAVAAPDQPAAS